MRNVLLSACLVLAVTSCGGGGTAEAPRDAAARGIITLKPSVSTPACGKGCTLYFYDDGSSSSEGDIVKWEWNTGDGWVDATATQGTIERSYTEEGNANGLLRLTDSSGNRAQAMCRCSMREGTDSEPVCFVTDFVTTDASKFRYHEWRWRCYDPEDSAWPPRDAKFEWSITGGDLDGDGRPDEVFRWSGDPDFDLLTADLDGDSSNGEESSFHVDASGPTVTFVTCPSKSKEDVYVWKVKTVGANGEGKKEYVGHVTLLK